MEKTRVSRPNSHIDIDTQSGTEHTERERGGKAAHTHTHTHTKRCMQTANLNVFDASDAMVMTRRLHTRNHQQRSEPMQCGFGCVP